MNTTVTLKASEFEKLEPHQKRVVIEHVELREKIDKLSTFMKNDFGDAFHKLSVVERDLLTKQHAAMTAYLDILTKRIAGFVVA